MKLSGICIRVVAVATVLAGHGSAVAQTAPKFDAGQYDKMKANTYDRLATCIGLYRFLNAKARDSFETPNPDTMKRVRAVYWAMQKHNGGDTKKTDARGDLEEANMRTRMASGSVVDNLKLLQQCNMIADIAVQQKAAAAPAVPPR